MPVRQESPQARRLNVYQGVTLLAADCLGTGVLALPRDVYDWGETAGLLFLALNVSVNIYAGRIFHETATALEERSLQTTTSVQSSPVTEHDALLQATPSTTPPVDTTDYIGLTRALTGPSSRAVSVMRLVYYTNIFLVLANYSLVAARAIERLLPPSENTLLLGPLLISAASLWMVAQFRTMAGLGQYVSLLSLLALAVVVVLSLRDDSYYNVAEKERFLANAEIVVVPWWRKASAAGSVGFAVGSQKLFLNIRHDLTHPVRDGVSVLTYALIVLAVVYTIVIVVALRVADHRAPPRLLLSPGNPVAAAYLWAHVLVSYAINSQALCGSVERWLFSSTSSTETSLRIDDKVRRWRWMTLLVALTALCLAYSVPFFDDLVGFIGSLTSVPVTLLVPALVYRYLHGYVRWEHFPSLGLTVFATVFTVAATVGSVASIWKDEENRGS